MTEAWKDAATEYLRDFVAPNANAIDSDVNALRQALDGLCERGLMALRRPVEYGGPEANERDFRHFQVEVARASGTLAFLQTQHQSAVSLIAKCPNEELKRRVLPLMHDGQAKIGIGFSQLRRPGPPIMRAELTEGGYILNGTVPWITGFGFFSRFVIGAQLPSGEAVFGIVPFSSLPGISLSESMKLAAMEAAQTVSGELTDWFLADEDVLQIQPQGWIFTNDMTNILLQGYFALGCARAGLDVVLHANSKRQNPLVAQVHAELESELAQCQHALEHTPGTTSEAEKHRVRGWVIDLMARCAHAGVVASSGAANTVGHSAQRVWREAIVFSVSGQTTAIMEATLARLTRPDAPNVEAE